MTQSASEFQRLSLMNQVGIQKSATGIIYTTHFSRNHERNTKQLESNPPKK